MAFYSAKDSYVVFGFNIPKSERMVLGHREEEVGVLRMELNLIDGVAMAHKTSDTSHGCWGK